MVELAEDPTGEKVESEDINSKDELHEGELQGRQLFLVAGG